MVWGERKRKVGGQKVLVIYGAQGKNVGKACADTKPQPRRERAPSRLPLSLMDTARNREVADKFTRDGKNEEGGIRMTPAR